MPVSLLHTLNIEDFLKEADKQNGNNAERVYFFILKKIFKREYEVGSRITESQIVNAMGVSNGPVREAFSRLRSDGWIETTTNMRSIIIDYNNIGKFKNIYRDRSIIEVGCVAELAKTASYRQLADLEEVIENIEKAHTIQDYRLHSDSDLLFHYKAVEFIAGKCLFNLWRHITLQLFCFEHPTPLSENVGSMVDLDIEKASHRSIFNAIAAQNVVEARRLVEMHLDLSFHLNFQRSPKQNVQVV